MSSGYEQIEVSAAGAVRRIAIVAQQAQAESEDFGVGVLAFLRKEAPELEGR